MIELPTLAKNRTKRTLPVQPKLLIWKKAITGSLVGALIISLAVSLICFVQFS
jgi:hypothetical protein